MAKAETRLRLLSALNVVETLPALLYNVCVLIMLTIQKKNDVFRQASYKKGGLSEFFTGFLFHAFPHCDLISQKFKFTEKEEAEFIGKISLAKKLLRPGFEPATTEFSNH